MLHCKIKTEKTDAGARNRLDAVLQGLVERSDSEREQNEEDSGKIVADSLSKDLSPPSAGKRQPKKKTCLFLHQNKFREILEKFNYVTCSPLDPMEPSSRFPQHRRKKRKEMDDGLAEPNQHKPNAYIIKLFDRSVDLAQFSTTTPLYPICRAWMRNNPSMRERTAPSPPHSSGEDEMTDMLNGKGQNVYRLPPPVSCPVGSAGETVNLRIPPVEKSTESQSVDAAAGTSPLIFNHIKRWKKIRQKWKEASSKNQLRYSESIKILKEIYER